MADAEPGRASRIEAKAKTVNVAVERVVRGVRVRGRDLLDRIGPKASEHRVIAEAARYWSTPTAPAWEGNSHWREGIPGRWERVGPDHLALFEKLSRVLDRPPAMDTVLEWGCGGGANAVAFAPRAGRFVGVDVVGASLAECERRARAVCDTPLRTVRADVEHPERAVDDIGRGECDVFLCLYVFELLPSRDYALRVLDIARELLRPNGVAFVQIKYRDTHRTPHKRGYARNLAAQTIFPIDAFWQAATDRGFRPEAVSLVPENELDRNYAYLLLTRLP